MTHPILNGPIYTPPGPPRTYLDEFDPNAMPEPYATYTHGRTPYFKLHSKLSHATSACVNNARSGVLLFERQGNQWVEIARFQPMYGRTRDIDHPLYRASCNECGGGLLAPSPRDPNGQPRLRFKQRFARDHNGRLLKPVAVETICSNCTYVY